MGMDNFFDIYDLSLNKHGEELCGDKVQYLKTDNKIIVVLSDGLGSGVKANILATLTTEIVATMLDADVSLDSVLETIVATLPVCRVRKIAYSTFTIVEIDRHTNQFRAINFDNPPIFYFRKGRAVKVETNTEKILNKKVSIAQGNLERGDFLGAISDGVLYAGLGVELNFGWGWDNISKYMEEVFFRRARNSEQVVRDVINKTRNLYHDRVGDDATFVGVYVRQRNPLTIFTGPPLDEDKDELYTEKFLNAEGRKIICGGTTGNIVARYLGETVEMDVSTMRKELPPIGMLDGIDLVTEGILTISKATELIKSCRCDLGRLKFDNNGACLLAREILQADSVHFLVGQQINEFYQNPLLPKNISIRRNLIEDLVNYLREHQKEVELEYC